MPTLIPPSPSYVVSPRPAGARTQKAPSHAAAAAAAAAPRRPKKKKAAVAQQPAYPVVVQDARWLAAQRARPGFLLEDISCGLERRKIPVFNEEDGEGPPQGLTYVRCVVPQGWAGSPRAGQEWGTSVRMDGGSAGDWFDRRPHA